jgi:hypothetical protein
MKRSRTGEDEERNELMENGYISWHVKPAMASNMAIGVFLLQD